MQVSRGPLPILPLSLLPLIVVEPCASSPILDGVKGLLAMMYIRLMSSARKYPSMAWRCIIPLILQNRLPWSRSQTHQIQGRTEPKPPGTRWCPDQVEDFTGTFSSCFGTSGREDL